VSGSQIAFRCERKGGGIFVMGATGESVRRVTDHGFDPAWSPDGQELVVAGEPLRDPMSRKGGRQLWAVRTIGEGKRLISEGDGMGPTTSRFAGRQTAAVSSCSIRAGFRPGCTRSRWRADLYLVKGPR
jgi:hypothetical protein